MITSIVVLLMLIAKTTSAFLQSPYITHINHNTNPLYNAVDDQINNAIMERRSELLSDNIRNEQTVRETLLSTRLSGLNNFLNKSEVRSSSILGAGRGLFAIDDIPKREVITCYPGDALLCKSEDDVVEDLLWGVHVAEADIFDEEAVFVGSGKFIYRICSYTIQYDISSSSLYIEAKPPMTAYSVFVDKSYSVLGHPSLDDNSAYYGHFANDGASMEGLDINEELGMEDNIATYLSKSREAANAKHQPFMGDAPLHHMVTRATRDIKVGDEIFVTYGADYWGIPALLEEAAFRNQVGQLLTVASVAFTLVSIWSFIQSLT